MICRQAVHEQKSLYSAAETLWRQAKISMVRTWDNRRIFPRRLTQAIQQGRSRRKEVRESGGSGCVGKITVFISVACRFLLRLHGAAESYFPIDLIRSFPSSTECGLR